MSSWDWYKVEQLPWPVNWAALFGRRARLVMEIGFGSGLFLVDLARRLPDANVLGLEISIPSLRSAARKVSRAGLTNVRLMQADANSTLHVLCEPGSIEQVYINFPDPWPKKNHAGRRLVDNAFLCLLASRMSAGGHLDIATDHDEYAVQIADCLQRSPYFASRTDAIFTLADEGRVQTKYERVALAEGRIPRYFQWRRDSSPVAERFPTPEEFAMPHVVFRAATDLNEIGRRFQPFVTDVGATRIRFVEAYQSLRDGKLLIECYLNEGPVMQRLGIELRARASGEVVISLAEIGFPRPTRGVHHAIATLVVWLKTEFPSLAVIQTNLQGDHADIAQ
jgi:tRNA (guanine-N7-)-methyltransferase